MRVCPTDASSCERSVGDTGGRRTIGRGYYYHSRRQNRVLPSLRKRAGGLTPPANRRNGSFGYFLRSTIRL